MNLKKLADFVIAPKEPKSVGSPEEWKMAGTRLGIIFPADYMWYIDHYGEGDIDELVILNPFTFKRSGRLDLSSDARAGSLLQDLAAR